MDNWISVADELPDERGGGRFSQWVLIAQDFNEQKFTSMDKYDHHNKVWVLTSANVTHWQPLPPPPND